MTPCKSHRIARLCIVSTVVAVLGDATPCRAESLPELPNLTKDGAKAKEYSVSMEDAVAITGEIAQLNQGVVARYNAEDKSLDIAFSGTTAMGNALFDTLQAGEAPLSLVEIMRVWLEPSAGKVRVSVAYKKVGRSALL